MNEAFWVGSLNGLAAAVIGNEPTVIEIRQGWTVMQFTGLKDKNGKEIYEGDVFEGAGDYGNGHHLRYVVEWSENEKWFWAARCINGGEGYYPDSWDSKYGALLPILVENGKLLGNIYEHPHLLRKE
jgi:uncharacterized phage protein (TIGR01671 family)